jgi:hypothetical protein
MLTAGGGGLAGVDMADDDDVDVGLLIVFLSDECQLSPTMMIIETTMS